MNDDAIRYDLIVQEALRGVVQKVLADVARSGLPGEHHFFITFRTGAAGVQLSKRMRSEYPDEMTIVLQHQFWDMKVDDSHFEVGLSFRNVPEKLSVPFAAVTGFADPSVQFALRFETDLADAQDNQPGAPASNDSKAGAEKPKPAQLRKLDSAPAADKQPAPAEARPEPKPKPDARPAARKKTSEAPDAEPAKDSDETGGANVVSIDAFRKKT
ncbi:MAG: ClpXP protease specificity-enhancing factor SspB [Beijerinckiaceae bacterium]